MSRKVAVIDVDDALISAVIFALILRIPTRAILLNAIADHAPVIATRFPPRSSSKETCKG